MGRSRTMSAPSFCSGMRKRWRCWKIYLKGMKLLYLRFSSGSEFVISSTVYCEALVSSQRCIMEEKNMPTLQKIQLRVKRLERTAMAAHVFALIQHSRVCLYVMYFSFEYNCSCRMTPLSHWMACCNLYVCGTEPWKPSHA